MTESIGTMAALLLAMQAQPVDATSAAQPAAEGEPTVQRVAATEEAKVAEEDDKIICRRTAVIGSKFKKKICGTKKQWETLANRGSETTRRLQQRGKGLEPNDSNKPAGF